MYSNFEYFIFNILTLTSKRIQTEKYNTKSIHILQTKVDGSTTRLQIILKRLLMLALTLFLTG
jgi:hypothetical protein